jgi:hypothetical protein
MIGTDKKRHRAVEITDPDFGCAGVEVEGEPLLDLRGSVEPAYDFDADVGRSRKNLTILIESAARRVGKPGDIDGFDAIRGGNGTNHNGSTIAGGFGQLRTDRRQSACVEYVREREHHYPAMPITFDPVRDFGQKRISKNFLPAFEVKTRLRFEIRELDRDRHAGKIRQKCKKAEKARTE